VHAILQRFTRPLGASAFTAGCLLFLYAPIVIVVLFALHSSARLTFPFEGFSLRWFRLILTDPAFTDAIKNSAIVGGGAALATFLLGTLAALGIAAAPTRARGPLALLFFAPLMLPALFIGLALLTYFSRLGIKLSLWTVTTAHVIYAFPYFILIARAALDRLDPGYDELGADLGASALQRFQHITFPLVWPILLAASILVFAVSFDEFIITFFVIGADSTVPLVLWSIMRRSVDPSINALATLLLAITTVGALLTATLILGRRFVRRSLAPE
jgi:spermidine/putrescine transport system permease protein